MHLLLGGTTDFETRGPASVRMVVIETEGAVEQADTLKAAFADATAPGLHLTSAPLDAAAAAADCRSLDRIAMRYPHRAGSAPSTRRAVVACTPTATLRGYGSRTPPYTAPASLH